MSKQKSWVFSKLFYRSLEMLLHEIMSGSFTNPSAWEIYATQIHLFPANCTFISSSHRCKAVQAGVRTVLPRLCFMRHPQYPIPTTVLPSPARRHGCLLCLWCSGKKIFGTHSFRAGRDWQSVLYVLFLAPVIGTLYSCSQTNELLYILVTLSVKWR